MPQACSELLAGLTPESLAGLEPADKQRLIEILKDLQLTGFQRFWRDLRARVEAERRDHERRGVDMFEEHRAQGLPSLADAIARLRVDRANPNREPSLGEKLWQAPDHQAFLARQEKAEAESQQELAEQFRKAQERYAEHERERTAEETPLPASQLPRPVSIAEVARQAQEQAFAEANREPDFISRICGPGSTKPSGRPRRGWMD